jgi:hypothetical protein
MCSLMLAAACAAAIAGCRPFNWRGQGYDEQTKALTKDLRPPADESRLTGLDARARDIERSLGVR